jgi:hypothetical protein
MPKLSLVTPHALGEEEASRRLRGESDAAVAAFGDKVKNLEQTWADNTLSFRFTALGMAVRGNVTVEPSAVKTTADLPLAAMMFKGAIEQQIQERLGRLLAT